MWSRSYLKIWGVFQFEQNLLCKLAVDLAEFFIEQGDELNSRGDRTLALQNYDRSLKLYDIVDEHLAARLESSGG
ncbi:unnamed protein product [Didymodactylos carnosus]|uniref:Uncharacterized protein n=1 Tax=Didymodactylos carnosus TaxID=1234261 RepID=A0A814MJN6_9BILA|nr:unnamed protein product [Didymodactylos carnosus]CAF3845947.1 unnamed protein product [Didymodactylos carnosus]CAF4477039.1 unnamed protein product [Didymodactylos carnosus]